MKHCSNRNANHFAECHLKPPRMRVWCIGTFVTQARQLYDCINNDHAYLSTMRFETVITYTRIPLLTFHPPRFAIGQLPFRLTKNSCPRHTKMLLRFVNRPRRSTYHHAKRHHWHINTNPRTNPAWCQTHVYMRCRQCPTYVCIRFTYEHINQRPTHAHPLTLHHRITAVGQHPSRFIKLHCGKIPLRFRKRYSHTISVFCSWSVKMRRGTMVRVRNEKKL